MGEARLSVVASGAHMSERETSSPLGRAVLMNIKVSRVNCGQVELFYPEGGPVPHPL